MSSSLVFLSLLSVGLYECAKINRNNVCSSYLDYTFIDFSNNCWYNPDVGADAREISYRYGYPFESYDVNTEDGYKLNVIRLPRKNGNNSRPVLLQHGVLCSAVTFFSLGKMSLPFKLHDAGYDVWMGNFRGTHDSPDHSNPNITDEEYWNFSFYELGKYDYPAIVELIAHKSGKRKIILIGYSMGNTAEFIYAITRKTHADEYLDSLWALAPVVYTGHVSALFHLIGPATTILKNIFSIQSLGTSSKRYENDYFKLCLYGPTTRLCDFVYVFSTALSGSNVAPENIPVAISHTVQGSSSKSFIHYGQQIQAEGRFQNYDYGKDNQRIYNQSSPPLFDITEIDLPVYLFYGEKDTLGDKTDVLNFYNDLKTEFKYAFEIPGYSHLDFMINKEFQLLYGPLFGALEKHRALNSTSN